MLCSQQGRPPSRLLHRPQRPLCREGFSACAGLHHRLTHRQGAAPPSMNSLPPPWAPASQAHTQPRLSLPDRTVNVIFSQCPPSQRYFSLSDNIFQSRGGHRFSALVLGSKSAAARLGEVAICQAQWVVCPVRWVIYGSQLDESGLAGDLLPFPASNYVLMRDVSFSE